MILIKAEITTILKHAIAGLLMFSSFAFAQTRSSVGQFSVNITLNGVATVPPGTCASQTLFNQTGAVVRVTCVDNPFVSITPSIDTQFPGTFGSTFRYLMFSSPNTLNLATASTSGLNSAFGGSNGVNFSSPFTEEIVPTGKSVVSFSFNSPTSTVTDMSIYRTAPQSMTDTQGLMDMVISF